MKIELSETPTDLIATHGLTAGTSYSVKAELPGAGGASGGLRSWTGPFVRIQDTGASAPTDLNDGYPIGHLDEAIIKSGADDTLWCWVTGGPGVLQVFESV